MVENEPCALPLSVESPPPYTDPLIPHYTECHLPPPPYMEPSMPIHHDRAALVVQRIYNTSVTMVQLLLKPLSKLDSQLVVQLLAHAEAIFAVLILTLSLIITQTTETYFCTYQLCDGYYGLFIGVFNLLLMSGFALIAVCFPWFKNSPLLFCQTGRCKLLTRIYLTLLCISNIFCGHLILLSSTYEITITRICLITVAVFKIIFSIVSMTIILYKKPYKASLNNDIKVVPGSVPPTAVGSTRCNLMVLYSTHTDTANIIQH